MGSLRPRTRGHLGEPDIRAVPVFIYALAEPGSMRIRYVGKSSNPKGRVCNHRTKGSRPMRRWLQRVHAAGQKPQLMILFRVRPGDDADVHERRLILECDAAGHDLLNAYGMPHRFLRGAA
jgi:hypothetical protein